jgi:hypothetical protein
MLIHGPVRLRRQNEEIKYAIKERSDVPIRAYFSVMFPALAIALLLISAYLQPHRPSDTAMLSGAHAGHANTDPDKPRNNDASIIYKLRALPIAARS